MYKNLLFYTSITRGNNNASHSLSINNYTQYYVSILRIYNFRQILEFINVDIATIACLIP